MTFKYRARVEDPQGDRWSILADTAAKAVEIATEQHAEIVWLRRLDTPVTI